MNVMEKLGVPEPQWILDRNESGPLFWRRDSGEKSRVKFRYDVEVKEFYRSDHELEEADWSNCIENSNKITIGLTYICCLAITVILPWYIISGTN